MTAYALVRSPHVLMAELEVVVASGHPQLTTLPEDDHSVQESIAVRVTVRAVEQIGKDSGIARADGQTGVALADRLKRPREANEFDKADEVEEIKEVDEAASSLDDPWKTTVCTPGTSLVVSGAGAVLDETTSSPDIHCRNASALATVHPFPADKHLIFEEEGHKYTIFEKTVDRSTTRVLGDFFGTFNPVACTAQFFAAWAANPHSQYHDQIQRMRGEGYDDDEVAARIRSDWTRLGEDASRLGTLLHLWCEYDCNGEPLPCGTDVSEISKEIEQYECFKASRFYRENQLKPYRTELTVAWRVGVTNVCAGQIDALYIDKNDRYYIVDFKRVGAKHALDPNEQGFRGAMGIGPAAHLADTHFQKYSLQTSIYNVMLHQTHGIDAGENMYLLRMHDDREAYELVKCTDHREVARKVLAIEYARLVDEATQ